MQHNSYVRVRIPEELKARLKLQSVDISEVVREALERVVESTPRTPAVEEIAPEPIPEKKVERSSVTKVEKVTGDMCPSGRSWEDHKFERCNCAKLGLRKK